MTTNEIDNLDASEFERPDRKRRNLNGFEQALVADSRVAMWLADELELETSKALMRLQSLPDLQRMAVMPDVHPSADVCVGCVLGTSELVFPQAIGGDIGCGMATVRLQGANASDMTENVAQAIVRELNRQIDVAVRSPARRRDPLATETPDPKELRAPHLARMAEREGMIQLGTLGRGNHFVEAQRDEEGSLWIMVHSGSRAMGQAVAGHYVRLAQREGVRAALLGLRRGTAAFDAYLADQAWCVEYARVNRVHLLASAARTIKDVLGGKAEWSTLLDIPHNLVRVECHGGAELIVHRKGSAPAARGGAGLIPGSAGTLSVHVEGRGDERSMCSSSHGAGRVMSRGDAKRRITLKDVRRQMTGVAYDERREHSLRDEAPGAYRDLRLVLEAQRELVKVTRTLYPVVSFKASG